MTKEAFQPPEDNQEPQVLIFAECDQKRLPPELGKFLTGFTMRIDGKGTTFNFPSPFRGDLEPFLLHSDKPRLVETQNNPSAISRVISWLRQKLNI